jgi:hypothetical protein
MHKIALLLRSSAPPDRQMHALVQSIKDWPGPVELRHAAQPSDWCVIERLIGTRAYRDGTLVLAAYHGPPANKTRPQSPQAIAVSDIKVLGGLPLRDRMRQAMADPTPADAVIYVPRYADSHPRRCAATAALESAGEAGLPILGVECTGDRWVHRWRSGMPELW